MNYLLDCDLSVDTLKKIIKNNSKQTLLCAEWNIERVVSSINYLKKIGINKIDNILINRFDLVLRGEESLKKSFDSFGKKKLVSLINKNVKNVLYLDQY